MLLLEEDLSGNLPANRILDEVHTLALNDSTYRIITLKRGKFFYDNRLDIKVGNNALIKGLDYEAVIIDDVLSVISGKPIYCFIQIKNRSLIGNITVSYQALGGNAS